MTNRDILDEIDALVDEQMNNNAIQMAPPTRCPHCGREFHGLAITERMEQMRQEHMQRLYEQQLRFALGDEIGEPNYAESELDPDYRYNEDDSGVLCPGSTFIGPRQPTQQEQAIAPFAARLDGLQPWQIDMLARTIAGRAAVENFTPRFQYATVRRGRVRHPPAGSQIPEGPPYLFGPDMSQLAGQRVGVEVNGRVIVGVATVQPLSEGNWEITIDAERPPRSLPDAPWLVERSPRRSARMHVQEGGRLPAWLQELVPGPTSPAAVSPPAEPESRFDDRGRPRPPRPSTTPPMWANNPTRERRRRRNN